MVVVVSLTLFSVVQSPEAGHLEYRINQNFSDPTSFASAFKISEALHVSFLTIDHTKLLIEYRNKTRLSVSVADLFEFKGRKGHVPITS